MYLGPWGFHRIPRPDEALSQQPGGSLGLAQVLKALKRNPGLYTDNHL